MNDLAAFFSTLCSTRTTILPKHLMAPGPSAAQLQQLFECAAQAPDHGQILPWRFILVSQEARGLLADQFAQALVERDAQALPHQLTQAREKAFRSPVLILAVIDELRGDPDIDLLERMVSAGCAIQNMLLMATAQGFGSAITSGKALKSDGLRKLFGLEKQHHALCFISVGTAQSSSPARNRPSAQDFVGRLTLENGVLQGLPDSTKD